LAAPKPKCKGFTACINLKFLGSDAVFFFKDLMNRSLLNKFFVQTFYFFWKNCRIFYKLLN
jgi:hypothetical protein